MIVIPGGLTPYLQADDICIYKIFKDNIGVIINEWKNSDKVSYTKAANTKAPSPELVNQWVREADRQSQTQLLRTQLMQLVSGEYG